MLVATCKKYIAILRVESKQTLPVNLLGAALLLCLTPVIFGVANLDSVVSSLVLERFVSLTGVFLLTPLFLPEQNKNIAELSESKYTSPTGVVLSRLLLSLISTGFLITIFILLMRAQSCVFDTGVYILGTFFTAFFLGSMGFTAYAFSNNLVVGYMLPFCYYMFNWFSSGNNLKNFYLFSLAKNGLSGKYWLFGTGIMMIALGLFKKSIVRKLR